ncbi:MAG TPA: thioredoxin family protein [Desulfuromonadales bacterium]
MKRSLVLLTLLLSTTVAWAELPSAISADVDRALAAGKPAVIDLGARTCIPCKKMAPILEELAGTYRGRANVLFIDVREDQSAAKRFAIQMIPTQVFFDGRGKEVKRHVGFMDKAEIIKELQALGVK